MAGSYTTTGTYTYTVKTTGTYDITAYGGAGGPGGGGTTGGLGAEEGGAFQLTQGEKLEIIVAGVGNGGGSAGGGGGGGSFVLANTGNGAGYTPLLVAGGGGGGYRYNGGYGGYRIPTESKGSGSGGPAGNADSNGYYAGGGGAGINGNGANANANNGGFGGHSPSNGAAGGGGRRGGGAGGLGGGGGGSESGGGGGGGFTGGYGGYKQSAGNGGGGTSYNAGTTTVAQSGENPGAGKVLIAEVTCYVTGTLIRTMRGDVAVEHLRAGDLAVTASGAQRPIRWIGHRSVDCRRHPYPSGVMPVRIAAHAFGPNRPARDLLVSPGHAICLDAAGGEMLVPAGALVNGTTITQGDVDAVTYWHVELDSHDILLAENLPAESYLEMHNRGFFAEAGVVALDAVPDAPPVTTSNYCRPFHDGGALVEAARAELRARAEELGWRLAAIDALGEVHLVVDGERVEAARRGLAVCFVLPAGARDVRLMSSAARPCDVGKGADRRWLGLAVAAISLNDGFEAIDVALDDPRLRDGFYRLERAGDTTWRWTNGRARLPAELWADRASPMLLRIDLHTRALPRWLAPAAAGVAKSRAA